MGGSQDYRNHLYNLFHRRREGIFRRRLEPSDPKEFCLVIKDLMPDLAGKIKYSTGNNNKSNSTTVAQTNQADEDDGGSGEQDDTGNAAAAVKQVGLDPGNIARSVRDTVAHYMYNTEYSCTKGLVVLTDTTANVAANKARTQQKRDKSKSGEGERSSSTPCILDEQRYDEYASHVDMAELNYLIVNEKYECQLDQELLWRTRSCKWQFFRVVTEELLAMPLRHGLKLVIDDGISISDEHYKRQRERMIKDYGFEDRSEYEKECLVACLAQRYFTEVFTRVEGQETVRRESTRIGEADVKFPRFITAPVEGRGTHSYMVVTPDTDAIGALLAHMKTLVGHDDGVELWLDSQTPTDRKWGISRPYRFINIRALYYAIVELFREEYPNVENPIETLIFLINALETDFTAAFDPALRISPAQVWNTFSELHAATLTGSAEDGTLKRQRKETFIRFNNAMADSESSAKNAMKDAPKMGLTRSAPGESVLPRELYDVLSRAVTYVHEPETDCYRITIDDVKCQQFLYFLCQFRVISDMALLGNTEFDKKRGVYRKFITNRDELLAVATGIMVAAEEHIKAGTVSESKKRKALDDLAERMEKNKQLRVSKEKASPTSPPPPKKKQASFTTTDIREAVLDSLTKPLVALGSPAKRTTTTKQAASTLTIDDEIREADEKEMAVENIDMDVEGESAVQQTAVLPRGTEPRKKNARQLEEIARRNMPPMYGIPLLPAMLARILRIEWLMNYNQNGWKDASYSHNFVECDSANRTQSKHGWKAREIPQTSENIKRGDFNNSYYMMTFPEGPIERGRIPCRVYAVSESDDIYNRNYQAYMDTY